MNQSTWKGALDEEVTRYPHKIFFVFILMLQKSPAAWNYKKNGLSTSAQSSWYVTAPMWKCTAGIVCNRGSWSPNSSDLIIFVLHLSTDEQTKDKAGIVRERGWKGWKKTRGGSPSWASFVWTRWKTGIFENVCLSYIILCWNQRQSVWKNL